MGECPLHKRSVFKCCSVNGEREPWVTYCTWAQGFYGWAQLIDGQVHGWMYVECIKYTDRNGWMIPYIFPVQIRRGDVVKEERWDRGGRRPISTRRREERKREPKPWQQGSDNRKCSSRNRASEAASPLPLSLSLTHYCENSSSGIAIATLACY